MNRSRLMVAGLVSLATSMAADAVSAQSVDQVSPSPRPAPLASLSRTRSEAPMRAAGPMTLTPWLDEWAKGRAERPVRDQEALDAEANAAIADPDSGVFIRDPVALSAQVRTVADRVRQVQARDAVLREAPPVRRTVAVAPEARARAGCRDCLSADLRDWARQRAWGPAGDPAALRAEAEAVVRAPWSGVDAAQQRDPALIDALISYLTEQMRQTRRG